MFSLFHATHFPPGKRRQSRAATPSRVTHFVEPEFTYRRKSEEKPRTHVYHLIP